MLLPAIAFVSGLIVFGVTGTVVLKILPSLGLSLVNLLIFVAGGFIGSLVFGSAFPLMFGKTIEDGSLVVAYLAGIFLAGVLGGIAAVHTACRFRRAA